MDKVKHVLTALIAVLTPIHSALLATFALIVIDLFTGIIAAYKEGESIESGKIKVTVVKLLVYELAIIMAWIVGQYLVGPEIPVLSVVTSVIGLTEVKSVGENVRRITGLDLFAAIISRLSPNDPDKK